MSELRQCQGCKGLLENGRIALQSRMDCMENGLIFNNIQLSDMTTADCTVMMSPRYIRTLDFGDHSVGPLDENEQGRRGRRGIAGEGQRGAGEGQKEVLESRHVGCTGLGRLRRRRRKRRRR